MHSCRLTCIENVQLKFIPYKRARKTNHIQSHIAPTSNNDMICSQLHPQCTLLVRHLHKYIQSMSRSSTSIWCRGGCYTLKARPHGGHAEETLRGDWQRARVCLHTNSNCRLAISRWLATCRRRSTKDFPLVTQGIRAPSARAHCQSQQFTLGGKSSHRRQSPSRLRPRLC